MAERKPLIEKIEFLVHPFFVIGDKYWPRKLDARQSRWMKGWASLWGRQMQAQAKPGTIYLMLRNKRAKKTEGDPVDRQTERFIERGKKLYGERFVVVPANSPDTLAPKDIADTEKALFESGRFRFSKHLKTRVYGEEQDICVKRFSRMILVALVKRDFIVDLAAPERLSVSYEKMPKQMRPRKPGLKETVRKTRKKVLRP